MKFSIGPVVRLTPFLLVLGGCLSYQEVTLKEIRSVELRSFDDHGVSVLVDVAIDNPNNYRIHVHDPDVDVFLDNEPLGRATFDSTFVLERKGERNYLVPVRATFEGGIQGLWLGGMSALTLGEARIRIIGTVKGRVGLIGRRIPFELDQIVPFHQ